MGLSPAVGGALLLFLFKSTGVAGELYDAVLQGNRDEVAQILAAGGDINDNGDLGSAIHAAAARGDVAVVSLLLDNGADIEDAKNPKGEPPLYIAVKYNQPEVAKLLIRRGARVDARAGKDETALHRSASLGFAKIAEVLIDSGADVDAIGGSFKATPLHMACWRDNIEIARLLLDRHANIEAVASDGYTPLLAAAESGSPELIELVISHGANLNVRSNTGMTPLLLARSSVYKGAADALLRHGAR